MTAGTEGAPCAGEGLSLRPWQPYDAPAVLGAFAPAEMSRQSGRPVTSPAEALDWIADRENGRAAGSGTRGPSSGRTWCSGVPP